MAHTWDPDRYLAYADERGRPFVELLQRVGAGSPARAVDLGCGPGNLTRLLQDNGQLVKALNDDAAQPQKHVALPEARLVSRSPLLYRGEDEAGRLAEAE